MNVKRKRYSSVALWALLLSILNLGLLLTLFLLFASFQQPCGGYARWDVKTCQDKGASKISLKTINTTISQLRLKKPSIKITNTTPRLSAELQTYTVDCRILKYILEEDGDYHIVIADLKDNSTMVAEIPNPLCDRVQKSLFINQISTTRSEFLKHTTKNGKMKPGIYRIKGVLFFDKLHGQTGMSPFGTELHPLLTFKKIQ